MSQLKNVHSLGLFNKYFDHLYALKKKWLQPSLRVLKALLLSCQSINLNPYHFERFSHCANAINHNCSYYSGAIALESAYLGFASPMLEMYQRVLKGFSVTGYLVTIDTTCIVRVMLPASLIPVRLIMLP